MSDPKPFDPHEVAELAATLTAITTPTPIPYAAAKAYIEALPPGLYDAFLEAHLNIVAEYRKWERVDAEDGFRWRAAQAGLSRLEKAQTLPGPANMPDPPSSEATETTTTGDPKT